jgi:hypothetical protein
LVCVRASRQDKKRNGRAMSNRTWPSRIQQ